MERSRSCFGIVVFWSVRPAPISCDWVKTHHIAVPSGRPTLAIADTGLMVLMWRLLRRRNVHRISGLQYLKKLITQKSSNIQQRRCTLCAFTEYLSRFGVSNVQKLGLGAKRSADWALCRQSTPAVTTRDLLRASGVVPPPVFRPTCSASLRQRRSGVSSAISPATWRRCQGRFNSMPFAISSAPIHRLNRRSVRSRLRDIAKKDPDLKAIQELI